MVYRDLVHTQYYYLIECHINIHFRIFLFEMNIQALSSYGRRWLRVRFVGKIGSMEVECTYKTIFPGILIQTYLAVLRTQMTPFNLRSKQHQLIEFCLFCRRLSPLSGQLG
jgi:hypothetical protein